VLITDHNVRETLGIVDRAYIQHDGQVLMSGTAAEVVRDEAVRPHHLAWASARPSRAPKPVSVLTRRGP
jgi:ABC-type lipopolysaccharide export system ATPase subunit